jgi:lanthanide-dependent methanol dehydrogenase
VGALCEVLRYSAVLGGLIASTSCVADPSTDTASNRVVAPVAAAPPDDGQWTMPAKNFASTRYSELAEINTENVAKLQVAFTFSMGVDKGQEAPPLVVNDTMYLVSPYPNILYALDLTKPGAPLKWKYAPKPEAAAQGVACCDVVNRGPVFSGGRLFYNTLDGIPVAVDAQTGKEVWRTKLGNIHVGETITMAPLVVKNKVLVGNSGGEMGVRGWIAALDADNGKLVWKAFNTGPDSEVLIGSDFKPFYAKDRGKDLGVSTWPPDAWKIGGGNVWGWISSALEPRGPEAASPSSPALAPNQLRLVFASRRRALQLPRSHAHC